MAVHTNKGVSYGPNSAILSCVFCQIISKDEVSRVEYEDEQYSCFRTNRPATPYHYLVVPKKHIQNVKSLAGPEGAVLVQELVDVSIFVLN